MRNLKIGFIGSGFIARFIAKAMIQVRHCEISAIYERSDSKQLAGFAAANGLGDPIVSNSIKEIVDASDAVAILTTNFARVTTMEQIAGAVESGSELKGVICEKPLGRNVEESQRMVDLAKSAGLKTAYFENMLFMSAINSGLEQLRPQMESMGGLMIARSTEEHAGPHSSWFWDPTQQGGGAMSDMGCHSVAVCRHMLTPPGKDPSFLKPVSMQCDMSLLKWGQPKYRKKLLDTYGVDYSKTPAEDFATGIVAFQNPETGQIVKGQFTDSWMFDKQGLRLSMDGLGPGYALEVNTLISPSEIFIGDEAAEAVADSEAALEKSTSTRGLLAIQPNEADLYGYVAELRDAVDAFLKGQNGTLTWEYGLEISRIVQAAYLSAEEKRTIDLTDPSVIDKLESYTSKIARGEGADVLF
ncbi:gfo/Idh/MocA family oxidoreductase [Rhodohalobacter sp. SW132]|uniref:Gfo/Idh/MocA family protein n=1 Tax=Rhodohalobacter sp. SW132 TaxID=2293433 RepID=UPI000E276995|nr:Gfo/Idh/MocA family oxidoreductase [Rhodohalobacter sp. SW132]REL29201.1 gfo/Idh/MocA family oxidoreductase [Rhodohalobacter sp. SW132]